LPPRLTEDNRNAHRAFVQTLDGEAIWLDYQSAELQNETEFLRNRLRNRRGCVAAVFNDVLWADYAWK